MTHEEKLGIMAQLIRMAQSDGGLREEEYDFLQQMAQRLEVEPMEVEKLFTSVKDYPSPQDELQRIDLFITLVEMINADNEVTPDEITLLREMGMFLGLRMQAVDQTIKAFDIYPNAKVPAEVIKSYFVLHFN